MRFRLGLLSLIAALAISSPPAHAQGTAADSSHWRATKIDLDSIARDRNAPGYSKRAQARIRARDSLRLVAPVTPPAPTPTPAPTPIQTTRVEIRPSTGTFTVGTPVQFSAIPKATDGTTTTAAVSWSAAPSSVATISGLGVLTPIAAGTVTVTARADTASRSVAFTIVAGVTPTPAPTPVPTPSPVVVDTTAIPPVPGRATLAELPRASVNTVMPTGYTVVPVGASSGALQAAIDAAGCRTELQLAANYSYTTPVVLRQKPCNETYHTVIRTANGLPLLPRGVRVTPGLSAQRQQARIMSVDAGNQPAVSADQMVRGYYFEDVAILAGGTQDLNALVKLGINQTTMAQVPGDFVFSHVYASGTPTLRMKRNFYVNSARTALVDSWCAEGHDNNGDSQCWVTISGPGPYLIENNYMEASHEVIMFGGGDPSIPNLVPCDVTIRRNHITRPASWKGVWTVKNLVESKNGCRELIEANVIENNWADGQVGYALLFKSVNQDGGANWSTTHDVTARYNLIRNTGAGINMCATCQGIVVPAYNLTFYDNLIIGLNVGQFTGEAREWQFLGALKGVSVTHNTTIKAAGVATAISFDGQPPKITGMDFRSDAYDAGQYDIHLGSGAGGWTAAVDSTTAYWTHSLNYAPGAWSAVGFDSLGYYRGTAPTHDGRPMGANAALVYQKTAGVVVTDPLRPQLRRPATPRQSGYKPTSPAQRAYNTRH